MAERNGNRVPAFEVSGKETHRQTVTVTGVNGCKEFRTPEQAPGYPAPGTVFFSCGENPEAGIILGLMPDGGGCRYGEDGVLTPFLKLSPAAYVPSAGGLCAAPPAEEVRACTDGLPEGVPECDAEFCAAVLAAAEHGYFRPSPEDTAADREEDRRYREKAEKEAEKIRQEEALLPEKRPGMCRLASPVFSRELPGGFGYGCAAENGTVPEDGSACAACAAFRSRERIFPAEVSEITADFGCIADRKKEKGHGTVYAAVSPVDGRYRNRTFGGVYIGNIPDIVCACCSPETGRAEFYPSASPLLYAPGPGEFFRGYGCFWRPAESLSDILPVTDAGIQNVWYAPLIRRALRGRDGEQGKDGKC